MAPSDDRNDLLLTLLIFLLIDGGDTPEAYDLLRYVERDFDRIFERNPNLQRAYPFPPHFLLRRIIDRRAARLDSVRARSEIDIESAARALALVSDLSQRLGQHEENLEKNSNDIKASLAQLQAGFADLVWALSIGSKLNEVKMSRNIPVRIYLSDDNSLLSVGDNLIQSIFDSLTAFGIEKSNELPSESGSWWKQAWGRTKEALSQEEVAERLAKLEHAASLKIIDKPQADITKANAEAASKMIKALEGVQSACVQIGNLLIVKFAPKKGDSRLIIRTLTASELIALEKNKAILKLPEKVIDMLDKQCLDLPAT